MRTLQLLKNSLTYYWRTNVSVVIGVATAVAVLSGALLVGDSVRGSLRDLFLQRLGETDYVISAPGFFRDQLAMDLQHDSRFLTNGFNGTCPLIVVRGAVMREQSRRQSGDINVYGVDERFFAFHNQSVESPRNRDVLVSDGLARELGIRPSDSLVLRIQKPGDIPVESLYGRKEDLGSTLRLTVRSVLENSKLGDFALQAQQGTVRAVFVSLQLLQRSIEQTGRVNTILISEKRSEGRDRGQLVQPILNDKAEVEDFGINLRVVQSGQAISVEGQSKIVSDQLAGTAEKAANDLSLRSVPILSYLANSITAEGHAIPYSIVTALDDESFAGLLKRTDVGVSNDPAPIVLNQWAARDLAVGPGATISLEYYLWNEDSRLETKTAQFRLAGVVPIEGLAADRDLVPEYPGITESQTLSEWDPPFPVDLKRVRKQDEDYWRLYRTTPKAFIPLAKGQELWQTRFGKLTSVRIVSPSGVDLNTAIEKYKQRLKAALHDSSIALQVFPARAEGIKASSGATDFGEYFLYFSFFIVVSALLLTALFFRLGVEQRLREIGTLEAIGFPPGAIRKLFLGEGLILSLMGSLFGLVGALAYGHLLLYGLRTWWVGAVGTTMLQLHVSAGSLIVGAVAGVLAALTSIALTLRNFGNTSPRSLLTGAATIAGQRGGPELARNWLQIVKGQYSSIRSRVGLLFLFLGVALIGAGSFYHSAQVAGFFGGGTLLLVGLLYYQSAWLRQGKEKSIQGVGWWPISRLGFRNTTYRPGRSVLCIALIASAAFIIVAVDAFKRESNISENDRRSGNGGFPLLAESLLPLIHDPNSPEGQESLNLRTAENTSWLENARFTRFRVRLGEDASCLNLYQPRNPRMVAADDEFIRTNRFSFQSSLAGTRSEKENPWLLLNGKSPDDAIPVIGDANSITYVLHLKLGDELVLSYPTRTIRLRIVGALADSLFQSELLMSEKNFLQLFPEIQGYSLFLIDTPLPSVDAVAANLEDRLADYGFNVVRTNERLAEFHRVENTYLSTFQVLGGLGLVLGTLGMAAVLLRNVLERRREMALLRAIGYNSSHFTLMVFAENAFLLIAGLVTGTVCALVAVAPIIFGRGEHPPNISLGLLLLAVLISGLTTSLVTTRAVLRSPLLPALRAE